jgi:hypothetical protein
MEKKKNSRKLILSTLNSFANISAPMPPRVPMPLRRLYIRVSRFYTFFAYSKGI